MSAGSALSALGLFGDEEADVFAAAADHGGDGELFLPGVEGFEDGGAFGGDGSFAVGGGLLEAPHRGRVVVGHGFDDATWVGQMTMHATGGRPLTLPKVSAKIVGMSSAVSNLPTTVLPDICDEHNCRQATSHPVTCRCSCGGVGHGVRAQVERATGAARITDRIARTGDPFLGAATTDRDIPVQRRQIPWCDDCMNCADDCDCEA
jgi:hypothetical protein